jgi:hypothetical protein
MQRTYEDDRRPRMANISPWTLSFDDKDLETEMRAQQVNAAFRFFGLAGVMTIAMLEIAGYGRTPVQLIASVGFCIMLYTMYSGHITLPSSAAPHFAVSILWVGCWCMSMLSFWMMVVRGNLKRLGPDDTREMVSCCCVWFISFMIQHVMCFSPCFKLPIYMHAITVVVTAPHWSQHLLAAMLVGETTGYSIEYMQREAFIQRAESVEQLQREKERVHYDLRIAQHLTSSGNAPKSASSEPGPVWKDAGQYKASSESSSCPCSSRDNEPRLNRTGADSIDNSSFASGSELNAFAHDMDAGDGATCAGLGGRYDMHGTPDAGGNAPEKGASVLGVGSAALLREAALWRTLELAGIEPTDE